MDMIHSELIAVKNNANLHFLSGINIDLVLCGIRKTGLKGFVVVFA
jgi:hypothetical protein